MQNETGLHQCISAFEMTVSEFITMMNKALPHGYAVMGVTERRTSNGYQLFDYAVYKKD